MHSIREDDMYAPSPPNGTKGKPKAHKRSKSVTRQRGTGKEKDSKHGKQKSKHSSPANKSPKMHKRSKSVTRAKSSDKENYDAKDSKHGKPQSEHSRPAAAKRHSKTTASTTKKHHKSTTPALKELTKDSLLTIAEEMLNEKKGLEIMNRRFHMKTYKRCFVSSDFVDWLGKHRRKTREESVKIGVLMVGFSIMKHVANKEAFNDGFYFYKFTEATYAHFPAITRKRQVMLKLCSDIITNSEKDEFPVEIADRRYHLRTYRDCFIASQMVTWLVKHRQLSREKAVLLGNKLLNEGLIRHVTDKLTFEDGHYFYTFTIIDAVRTHAQTQQDTPQAPPTPPTPKKHHRRSKSSAAKHHRRSKSSSAKEKFATTGKARGRRRPLLNEEPEEKEKHSEKQKPARQSRAKSVSNPNIRPYVPEKQKSLGHYVVLYDKKRFKGKKHKFPLGTYFTDSSYMAIPETFRSIRFDKGYQLTVSFGEDESIYNKSVEKFDPDDPVKSITFEKLANDQSYREC